jgi:hypothetical protein
MRIWPLTALEKWNSKCFHKKQTYLSPKVKLIYEIFTYNGCKKETERKKAERAREGESVQMRAKRD